MSAFVNRVSIPSNTLLPTPEPATKPIRWPRPTVNTELIAFTPTSKMELIGPRSIGLSGLPNNVIWSGNSGKGRPSKGCPRPSITRPNNPSPKRTWPELRITRTMSPGPTPTGSVNGIKYKVRSLKPTTSASIRWPCWPKTSQHAPKGAMMPRVSNVKPTKRTKVPLRCGSGTRNCSSVVSTSCAKSSMGQF